MCDKFLGDTETDFFFQVSASQFEKQNLGDKGVREALCLVVMRFRLGRFIRWQIKNRNSFLKTQKGQQRTAEIVQQ